MEAPGPLRGAQPSVELQKLLADVFDNVLADFIKLSEPDSSGQADRESVDQRKYRLLQHLHGTRQQLLRALALLNWKPWKVLNELVDHDRVLDLAASHVRTMTEVVQQMRQQAAGRIMAGSYLNMYDINTALEVLTTGTYQELPSIILQRPPLFQPPPASPARQRARLAHVTHLIRARLVQVALPPGLKVVSVSNGTVVLQAEGLYEAKLTLVPAEPLPGIESKDPAAGAAVPAAGTGTTEPGGGGGAGGSGGGAGYNWTAAGAAAAAADPVASAAASQRWKWRLIHFVLAIGVPFYDPRQPGQILNTCNFHMVLAADNAAYLRRQRQGASGAGAAVAAAGPAGSTISESAATPAASGLQVLGGAAGDGGGGGVSLAAAVRRTEDDEVGAPLAVMHAILTDVAGRLLADELAAAARALAAPGSRWHGHITVKPSQLLHPGVRIEYWTQAPPLLSYRVPGAGRGDDRSVKPGPPYLELGMGEGGSVEVLHSPSSLRTPISVSKLRLDTFRVNVEEVLMRAANMSSQFQLLQIRQELKASLVEAMGKRAPTMRLTTLARHLWCRDGAALHQPGTQEEGEALGDEQPQAQQQPSVPAAREGDTAGGAAQSSAAPMDVDSTPSAAAPAAASGRAPPRQPLPVPPPSGPTPEVSGLLARAGTEEEAAGALIVLNAPVLEYLVSGTTELKIGKHLFSGRLTLRPGQDERDEGSLDHAATISMNEDYVNQAAMTAYNSAPADSLPAWRALKEACNALCHVLQRTHTSTDATHFIQAARRAALHISRLPHGMLEAFTTTTPGLAIEPRHREKVATWSLQCVPFPPNFPPLEPVAPDTLPLRVPQCLTFFLQSRLSLTSPHVLVVCSCNKQLMPIKVLSCIPVPASTYHLPEQVVAAYMAVSSANHHPGHGGTGAAGGGTAHGHAPHSLPHSGPNTPRAGNGHDAGAPSPEASPRRDSVGGAGTGMLHVRSTGTLGVSVGLSTVSTGPGSETAGQVGLASSPPHSHSYSQLQGRVPSSGTAVSMVHPHRSAAPGIGAVTGTGGGGGAGTGTTGRPTGQQVAVMLAQQQLSSVVRWCRRRMVWEVLLVQLRAVGASFVELCNPPCQRVRVTSVAGTALPCYIVRRRGLIPPRVGPTCLELELGPDPLAGQVTARLYGRFLCSPGCAPLDRATGGEGGSLRRPVATTTGFVLDTQQPVPTAAAAHRGNGPGGGDRGDVGMVCLQRQYCLERGESALMLVQEVSAVIRMQALLARLEMTARPVPAALPGRGVRAQRLAVLTPPAAAEAAAAVDGPGGRGPQPWNQYQSQQHQPPQQQSQQQQGTVCTHKVGGGEAIAPYSGGGGGCHASQPAAKRIKTEHGTGTGQLGPVDGYLNGGWGSTWQQHQQPQQHMGQAGGGYGVTAGMPNGVAEGHGGSGMGAGAAHPCGAGSPSPALSWHWPIVGTVTLEECSCSSATLRVSPCMSGPRQPASTGDGGGIAAMPPLPPPLQLHITWAPRDVRDMYGGGGGAGGGSALGTTPGTATPAPTPGGVIMMPPPSSSAPSPLPTAPGVAPSPLPVASPYPAGVVPTGTAAARPSRSGVSRPSGEAFGSFFSDLVLCTITCSSGHSLPQDYLQVLEEFVEAGEEGKLLDAVAVAAWPVAGFCAALRPAVLARHGLLPDSDVRLTQQQPPYCMRMICRRRVPAPAAAPCLST